jgi:hypothetical protein
MVCKSLHEWSKDWKRNIPNLKELENPKNWDEWVKESNLKKGRVFYYIKEQRCTVYRWAWLYDNVSSSVLFLLLGDVFIPKMITVQYEISSSKNYSAASIEDIDFNHQITGKRPGNLPANIYSDIYKEMRKIVAGWISCQKNRLKIFPYCSCISFTGGDYPTQAFLRKVRYYDGSRGTKIKELYVCDRCSKANEDLNLFGETL